MVEREGAVRVKGHKDGSTSVAACCELKSSVRTLFLWVQLNTLELEQEVAIPAKERPGSDSSECTKPSSLR